MKSLKQVKSGAATSGSPTTFVLSSEAVDSVGDIIRVKAWENGGLDRIKANPIALAFHDHSAPIGRWENIRIEGKRLLGDLVLAAENTSQRIDEIRSLVAQGILKACSVGFQVLEYTPITKDPYGPWDITQAQLHEISLVAVGANPESLALAKSMGISKETIAQVFADKGKPAQKHLRSSGVTAPKATVSTRGKPMDLKSKIIDAEKRLEDLKDEVTSINKAADDDGRDLHDEETDLINEYGDQIDALSKSISGMKRSEILMGQRAVEAANAKSAPRHVAATAKAKEEPGTLFAKMAIATMQAEKERKSIFDVAEMRFGQSDERVPAMIKAMLSKGATEVATTTNDGWASQLAINETIGFLEALTGNSVYAALSSMGTAIPFGNANSITMPYRAGSGTVPGSFVQENGSIPVKQDLLTSKTFNRFKMAVITAMSNEVINVSQPGIVEIVRRAILDDTAESLDKHAISTLAGVAGVRPPGLLVGAANQPATTPAGESLEEILTDIRYLRAQLLNANAFRQPAFLMHPTNADALALVTNASGAFVFPTINAQGGTLLGTRVITSTHMDPTIVVLTDAADWATAFGDPSFEMSQSATLVMVDDDGVDPSMYHSTDQTPGVDVAGSVNVSDAAGVVGGPAQVRSMFQTNAAALRLLLPVSYGSLRAGTTAYITSVAW